MHVACFEQRAKSWAELCLVESAAPACPYKSLGKSSLIGINAF